MTRCPAQDSPAPGKTLHWAGAGDCDAVWTLHSSPSPLQSPLCSRPVSSPRLSPVTAVMEGGDDGDDPIENLSGDETSDNPPDDNHHELRKVSLKTLEQ